MTHRTPTITWLLAIFFLLASSYSLVNPLFEAPDEVWHYELIRWLAEGNGLPEPADIGNAPWQQEGAQPPLYYLLGAALTAPIATDNASEIIRYNPHAAVGNADAPDNKNIMAHGPWEDFPWQGVVLAVHLVRFLSILLGMITVYFTWRSAKLLFPDSSTIPWLAAALVALNPQFLFISASVTNDTLITCCSAIGIWLLLRILSETHETSAPPSLPTLIGLGFILGLAALSKVSGLALSGLAGIVLAAIAWQRRSWIDLLRIGSLTALVAVALAGWWYGRNWQLFGDPLAISVLTSVLPGRDVPLRWAEILSLVPGVWRSYWGVFGWFNVLMDGWFYAFYSGLSVLALAGLLVGMRHLSSTFQKGSALLLALWTFVNIGLVVRWAQINYPQGRLLFPAIGALAILLAFGLLNNIPKRAQMGTTALFTALLLIPAIAAPWRWIGPTYRPPTFLAANSPIQYPLSKTFGNLLQLHGYTVSSDSVASGDVWSITLDWSNRQSISNDYTIFVHLTDENGILQAQSDSFPAGGSLPTRAMQIGEIVPDLHTIQIPPSLPALGRLKLDIGVYDYQSGERLTVDGNDFLALGMLDVQASASNVEPIAINFEDKIELRNYGIERTLAKPGETLNVVLSWRALQPMATDYVVFVHLLLPPDSVWAQIDEQPLQGQQPTSSWQKDQIIEDNHTLMISPEAPPGIYRIEIGLYDAQTLDRLKVGLEDAGIVIGFVRVE